MSSEAAEIAVAGSSATLTIVPRETGGWTFLTLWIDAGSRDADPPIAASLAASLASRGHEVEPLVTPDGTRFATACENARLTECMQRLARVLATRTAAEPLLADVKREVGSRRARHQDAEPMADRLAVTALLGEVSGLDPLEGDLSSLAPAGLGEYFGAHYGPERSHVVAVGDGSAEEIANATAIAFAGLESASRRRSSRQVSESPDARVRVEFGDASALSVATRVPSLEVGIAWGQAAARFGVHAGTFSLRGAHLLVLRGQGEAPLRALSLIRSMRPASVGDGASYELTPLELGDTFGARWVARGDWQARAGGLGVGSVRPSVEARIGQERDERAQRSAIESALLERARELWEPEPPTVRESDGVSSASFASGGGIRVEPRPSEGIAIALSFALGASEEPAALLGRRALLAEMLQSCIEPSAAEAWVDESSIGVVVTVARTEWNGAVLSVARCMESLDLSAASLERTRGALIARHDQNASRLAWLAAVLAPEAPSRIAAGGTIGSLAAVDREMLVRLWESNAVRTRLTLAVVGGAREEILGVASSLFRLLPSGSQARATPPARPALALEAVTHRASADGRVEVLFGMRDLEMRANARAGTLAVARGLERELGPRLRVIFGQSGDDWIGFSVLGDESSLSVLPALIDRARARVREALEPLLDAALQDERRRNAVERSIAATRARALTREQTVADRDASLARARALLAAELRYVFVRP